MIFRTNFISSSIVTGLLLVAGCAPKEAAEKESVRPVRAAVVADAGELERRSFPGRAKATQEVDLSFRVKGPLITLPINVGDTVEEGDLLARIDPRDFEVRLRNAESQLQRTKANLERASTEYQRLLGIRKKDPDLVSEVHVERAKADFLLAEADTAALEATVDAARDELGYTYLKAPFDGTIVAKYVENFESVMSRQTIMRLLDSRRVEFEVSVPETVISLVQHLTNVRVRFDATPDQEIPAEVYEIGTEASEITRTYPVTLIMDQPQGFDILPGMAGKAMGIARPPEELGPVAIVVPVTAVFRSGVETGSSVWVIDPEDNTVHQREVALGSLVNSGVEIVSGLEAGELIATAGAHFLAESQEVRPTID